MRDTALLQLALGLTPPWTVSRSEFDPEARRLDIEIDFAPGSRFACPTCGAADCPAYRADDLASSKLLPAPGLFECPRSARPLRHVRRQDRQRGVTTRKYMLRTLDVNG